MEYRYPERENLPCRQYQMVRSLHELQIDQPGVKQYFQAGLDLSFNPEIREDDLLAVVPGLLPAENSMILVRFQGQFRVLYYHREAQDEMLLDAHGNQVVCHSAPGDSLQILGTVTSVIHQISTGREQIRRSSTLELEFPQWVTDLELESLEKCYKTHEEKLRLVFCLAERNVLYGTGGPFGAAVFEEKTGRIIAMAVNTVLSQHQSFAHAEMMAIAKTHRRLRRLELSDCILVSSCEPCAMCTGGILWSGIGRVIYGASGSVARETGFDEGDKLPSWKDAFAVRNITVEGPFMEKEAREAFILYEKKGGKIY